MKAIPIDAAEKIAHQYGYDQVIIVARAVGEGEHVTTYGKDKANCDVAARIGNFLKYKVMGWVEDSASKEFTGVSKIDDGVKNSAPMSALAPFCTICGWRKSGVDSWDGEHCKCGRG